MAASDYFKHRIRHWLPQARCQLLSSNVVDFHYDIPPLRMMNKPTYLTLYSDEHFCWLAKYLPSRLKTLWESGGFFEYFENINKKRTSLFYKLINEVTSTGKEARFAATGLMRVIPIDEMTITERVEYMVNIQKEFNVKELLKDKTFQAIRDQTEFDFSECEFNRYLFQ